MTVDGVDSKWTIESLAVGYSGAGTLNIGNAGRVAIASGVVGENAGSTGAVAVDGAGSTWEDSSYLVVGGYGSGALTVSNGGSVANAQGVIGDQTGSDGTVTVDGAGSTWTNTDNLYVGNSGIGTLTVSGGGGVSDASGVIGSQAGSTGTVSVDGAGSKWTNAGEFDVGLYGDGTLTVSNGGSVSSDFGSVGYSADSHGSVTVEGVGSKWSYDDYFDIGHDGTGTLDIKNGGSVSGDSSYVGAGSGSNGMVTVDGTGSTWTIAEEVDVGGGGDGTLDVTNGGSVSSDIGNIGSTGAVAVDGAGSKWTNSSYLYISGVLTVSNGGSVSGTPIYVVSPGTVVIGGMQGGVLQAPGTLDAPSVDLSSGAGLEFDHTGTNYSFDPQITNSGAITQIAGTTVLTGDSGAFTGSTDVTGGTLRVDGTLGAAGSSLSVASGGTLGGGGTVGGDVTIASGGTLSGASGSTLTINNLALDAGANVDVALGAPSTTGLFDVANDLTLNGTLNVANAGGFGNGLYRLFDYGGTLGGAGLTVGTTPDGYAAGDLTVQTAQANQINLLVAATTTPPSGSFDFWNGTTTTPGALVGGSGTWSATGTNWTNTDVSANGTYDPAALLIFTGTGGTVTVDANGGGLLPIGEGMQFASDGYVVEGDALAMGSGTTTIRVGDGTAAGAGYTATIAANLTGAGNLDKTDLGTLMLTGADSLGGNIMVDGGTLAISGGGSVSDTFGAIGNDTGSDGAVTVDGEGSTWTNTSSLVVGNSGAGTLGITNGGNVSSDGGSIGDGAGSIGAVTVDGAGSKWTMDSGLFIGASGAGTLDIKNGGGVSNTFGFVENGIVTVDGAGSTWANAGDLYVGGSGDGMLGVTNGGGVSSNGGHIGGNAGTTGTVTVDGPGSAWTMSSDLFVGGSGAGVLNIRQGGTVSNAWGFVDAGAGSRAATTVDGAGSTWTNNGSLYVGESGAGTLHISNGGAVVSTGDDILGANAGSNGSVTVDGDGSTLKSTGIQVGSGGDGTLVVSNGGVVSNSYGYIGAGSGSSGAVTVDGAGSTWTSTVELRVGGSGSGTLNISNGGLVDAASLSVGLDGGDGTVVIGGLQGGAPQAPGTLDAPVVNLYDSGALVFQHSDTTGYSFDPQIAGTGALEQVAGTTILTAGSGAFTGPTSISGGVLRVDGWIGNSAVTVNGGIVGGTGTVGDLIVEPGGTIAPGNSIGTLNVAGDVGFSAGSTYQVEVNAAGQSDLIAASGAAGIKGGAVDVLAGSGNYAPSTQYTILTADGGVNGTFDSVSSNFAFLAPTLTYDENNVYLELDRNGIDFDSIGGTPNERAAGQGVQSLDPGSAIYGAVLSLDIPSARAAFDALSGEVHASAQSVLIEDSRFVREAAVDRLRDAFDAVGATLTPVMSYAEGGPALAPATTDGLAVWTRGFGAWGSWSSDGNAARLDRSTGGLLMGADVPVGAWRFGVLTGYSYTSFDVKDRSSSGVSRNYHLGLYGGTQWGNLALRTGAAYTWHDLSFDRSVGFPGFSDQLAGGYSADTAQAFAELGYGFHAGNVAFEPFANLAYVSLSTDGFTERGGVAALKGKGMTTDATFTTLGVHASTDFDLGGIQATARGTLGWRHAFGNATPKSTLSFAGGSPFSIAGVPIAMDAAVIEAGLDFGISRNATLGLSYNGQFGSDVTDQSIRANFSMKF
ncbi:MAG: hypothetical protein BGN87_13100 [Rhizobiales bacterium 65-79]|nr:MAG: hypothetical protein BGN87_13100 [Rhizobiales bacterium 65-79]